MRAPANDQTDIVIGERIKLAREKRDMSQTQLAERVGVSRQQLQKYENAADRVSASKLKRIADALRFPVAFFLETGTIDEGLALSGLDPEALQCAEALASIPSPAIRRRVALFVEALREDLAAEEERIRGEVRQELIQNTQERKPGTRGGPKPVD